MLLGCWLVVPCGAMRRKRRAARGCDSSGQAQGSCGGNASVCQLDPSRECAGFQQAPSLLGAKEMAGVGDEVPGNPPPYAPCPLWHGATMAFSFCMLWLPSSRSTVCGGRCAVGAPVGEWAKSERGGVNVANVVKKKKGGLRALSTLRHAFNINAHLLTH